MSHVVSSMGPVVGKSGKSFERFVIISLFDGACCFWSNVAADTRQLEWRAGWSVVVVRRRRADSLMRMGQRMFFIFDRRLCAGVKLKL